MPNHIRQCIPLDDNSEFTVGDSVHYPTEPESTCCKYPGRIQAKLTHARDPTSNTTSGLRLTSAARLQIADGLKASQYGGSNSA